jgi:cation transporter-like permease
MKESLKILVLTSILSSIGGFSLQMIQLKLIVIVPLLILIPALNEIIGGFGTIISSKFTSLLYMGKISSSKWWRGKDIQHMFITIIPIAFISSLYIGILSSGIAYLKGFKLSLNIIFKIIQISIISTLVLVSVIFVISIVGGLYIYKKNQDPDNFLIPITTSVADLGSMLIFSVFIMIFF